MYTYILHIVLFKAYLCKSFFDMAFLAFSFFNFDILDESVPHVPYL